MRLPGIGRLRTCPARSGGEPLNGCSTTHGGGGWTWNPQYDPLTPEQVERDYRYEDEGGRFTTTSCTNNAVRPNMIYEFHGNVRQWRYSRETMLRLERAGRLVFNSQGIPRRKRYLSDAPGRLMTNVWSDINVLASTNSERTSYPTQKPLALLERIIKASSNEGDLVLARTDIPRRTDIDAPRNYRKNKHVLYGQQEGQCGGCGMDFPFKIFEVDHVIPRSKGGGDHIENLQLLCPHCNRMKGNRGQEYLMAQLQAG